MKTTSLRSGDLRTMLPASRPTHFLSVSVITLWKPAEYQPNLHLEFAEWSERLLKLGAGRVEHIGASSVPGALSKGDLDVLAVVDATGLEVFRHTLTGIGFHEKPGNLRTPELCMMVHPQLEHFAIQLVARGSEFEHLFLGFRDALLENESLVREYNRVKMAASELDDASYRAAKEQFIHRILATPRVKRSGDGQARRAADRDPRAS